MCSTTDQVSCTVILFGSIIEVVLQLICNFSARLILKIKMTEYSIPSILHVLMNNIWYQSKLNPKFAILKSGSGSLNRGQVQYPQPYLYNLKNTHIQSCRAETNIWISWLLFYSYLNIRRRHLQSSIHVWQLIWLCTCKCVCILH